MVEPNKPTGWQGDVTPPEKPVTPPVAEPEPEPEVEKPVNRTPLTVEEVKDTAREVGNTVKNGVLFPVYDLGRRLLRGAEGAASEFFDGATGEKKEKK